MNDSLSDDQLLQQYVSSQAHDNIPVIIYIIIIVILGVVGNTATAIYYYRKCKLTTFFLFFVLSINDLLACVINIGAIVYLFSEGDFEMEVLCVDYSVLSKILFQNSVYLLTLICVNRYIAICRPLSSRNFTVKKLKWFLAALFTFSIVIGSSYFVVYDIVDIDIDVKENRTVFGHFCKSSLAMERQPFIKAVHIIDAVMFAFCVLLMVMMYFQINRKIVKTVKARERLANMRLKSRVTTGNSASTDRTNTTTKVDLSNTATPLEAEELDKGEEEGSSDEMEQIAKHFQSVEKRDDIQTLSEASEIPATHTRKRKTHTTRVTSGRMVALTTFMTTLILLLSFMPYIIAAIGKRVQEDGFDRILSRSFMLTSSLNPYVNGCVNRNFRAFIWRFITTCIPCFRKRSAL